VPMVPEPRHLRDLSLSLFLSLESSVEWVGLYRCGLIIGEERRRRPNGHQGDDSPAVNFCVLASWTWMLILALATTTPLRLIRNIIF
jgi:hypothetical protein